MSLQVSKGDRFVKYDADRKVKASYVVSEVVKPGATVITIKNADPSVKKPISMHSEIEKLIKEGYEHEPERRTAATVPIVKAEEANNGEKAPEKKTTKTKEKAPEPAEEKQRQAKFQDEQHAILADPSPIPRYRCELTKNIQVFYANGAKGKLEKGRTGDAYYAHGVLWFEPNTRKEDERIPFPLKHPSELKVIGVDEKPEVIDPDVVL
jgi:hypothetical protein